jgi:DNA/RNA-binding domain of Phe-tRNA-synthetase-like protein
MLEENARSTAPIMEISESWRKQFPGAVIGVLVMRGARNPPTHSGLDRLREKLEMDLRAKFFAGGKDALRTEPVMAAYRSYYKRFGKTYHVELQLDSVIWKDRTIPSRGALVQAMSMAELKNMLLTAGHDLAGVAVPLRIDVGTGSESYVSMGGTERVPKEGDMLIADVNGILSSIIYGPDNRTALGPDTKDVLFTVYAPAGIGIEPVRSHLEDIQGFVRLVAPDAVTEELETCSAD